MAPPLPTGRCSHWNTVYDDKLVVVGGFVDGVGSGANTMDVFDHVTQLWSRPALPLDAPALKMWNVVMERFVQFCTTKQEGSVLWREQPCGKLIVECLSA